MFEPEGLGRTSAYTDLWINHTFDDFYDLARGMISPKMMKIKNEGFQKLLKNELRNRGEYDIKAIEHYNELSLKISDWIIDYLKEHPNAKEKDFNALKEIQSIVDENLSLKMFKYGVQLGMELKKDGAVDNFKW